jgi:gamma-glutamylcyclotransferase (GGCT)/AIG2-like uncharacterized protein YtfP
MIDLLFVYGTLRPDAKGALGTNERVRLASESSVVGPAQISGRLFDLGLYPVLIASPQHNYPVHGTLLRLTRVQETFDWLDRYEDIDPVRSDNLYERVVLDVAAGNETCRAWVYRAHHAPAGSREVASGRWRAAESPDH